MLELSMLRIIYFIFYNIQNLQQVSNLLQVYNILRGENNE